MPATNQNAFALSPATRAYLKSVRLRPSMHIGRTDSLGLQQCILQFALLAVDEFIAGYGTRIEVTLNEDRSVTVSDNGRGLPTNAESQSGLAMATSMLTYPTNNQRFQVNGIDRLPISGINALARRLELRIVREGFLWEQDFVDGGLPMATLRRRTANEGQGTSLRFWPDFSVFENDINQEEPFGIEILQENMRRLACFYPGLECIVHDARTDALPENKLVRFFANSPSSILDLACHALGPARTTTVFMQETMETEFFTLDVSIAARPHTSDERTIVAFVNNEYTQGSPYRPWAGSHQTGFTQGLLEAINEYGLSNNLLVTPLLGGDVLPGTAAYLHVQFPHPVFNHRGALENLDIQVAVQKMVQRHLRCIFAQKPDIAMAWLGRAALTARRRLCGS